MALHPFKVFLVLALIGFVTFCNGFNNPFMIDDYAFFGGERKTDLKYIHHQILPDKNKRLKIESAKTDTSYYRPLAHIVPMLNYNVFKKNYMGYHVVNLTLWVLAAFLIYLLIIRLFNQPLIALLAALGYLVHPINGIVVNYITASVFGVQVICMTLSLMFILRASSCPKSSIGNPVIGVSILFFYLSLMCHETAMVLPFLAVWMLMASRGLSLIQALKQTQWLWLFWLAYFVFRLFNNPVGTNVFANIDRLDINFLEYLAGQGRLMGWYLSKFLLPEGITLMWATPPVRGVWLIWLIIPILAILLLTALIIRRFQGPSALGLGWLILGFIPLSLGSVVSPLQGFLIEPHWFVFTSVGFFIFFGAFLAKFWEKSRSQVAAIGIGFVFVCWILSSWVYNFVWGNELLYCRIWHSYVPDFKAVSYFLGKAHLEKGQYDEARYSYNQSLLNRYKDWIVYGQLGEVDLKQGKLAEAKVNFEKALKLEPKAVDVLTALASVNARLGNGSKAEEYILRAYSADGFSLRSYFNVAEIYKMMKDYPKAQKVYEQILQAKPCEEKALGDLMRILILQKNKEALIMRAREASACADDPVLLTMSGSAFRYYGFNEEAVKILDETIRRYPSFQDASLERAKIK